MNTQRWTGRGNVLLAAVCAIGAHTLTEGRAEAQEPPPATSEPARPTASAAESQPASSGHDTSAEAGGVEANTGDQATGNTRGYFQAGVGLFSPTGTLAGELEARGVQPWGGPTLTLGFTRAPKALPWFRFGAGARGTFGDRVIGDRGYFLNPVFIYGTLAVFAPLGTRNSGIEVAIDFGFNVILARNQEPVANNPNPLTKHEYGLGLGGGLRASYRLDLPAMGAAFKFTLLHSRHFVGVDVSEKPGKTWALGITAALAGIEW